MPRPKLISLESSNAFCQRLLGAPVLIAVIRDSGVSSSRVKSTTVQSKTAIPTAMTSGKIKSPKKSLRPEPDGDAESTMFHILVQYAFATQSVMTPHVAPCRTKTPAAQSARHPTRWRLRHTADRRRQTRSCEVRRQEQN